MSSIYCENLKMVAPENGCRLFSGNCDHETRDLRVVLAPTNEVTMRMEKGAAGNCDPNRNPNQTSGSGGNRIGGNSANSSGSGSSPIFLWGSSASGGNGSGSGGGRPPNGGLGGGHALGAELKPLSGVMGFLTFLFQSLNLLLTALDRPEINLLHPHFIFTAIIYVVVLIAFIRLLFVVVRSFESLR